MYYVRPQAEIDEEDLIPVITLGDTQDSLLVSRGQDGFVVSGPKIERFARRTDFDNPAGIERLRDIMRKMGIMHELERQKIDPDDTIIIGANIEYGRFEY